MISPKSIDEVFQIAQIEDVISDFLNLKRRGSNLIGNCPFHHEKTPSFIVSPSKNIYKCFGCGRAGSSINFIMEHESLTYVEAIRYLADKYKIKLDESNKSQSDSPQFQKRESLLLINDFINQHFKANLLQTDYGKNIALNYFIQRGFTQKIIEKFELGYAMPVGNDALIQLQNHAYNIAFAKEIGIITSSEKDFFVNRVMFPLHNISGKIVGFGGRTLAQNDKTPKYLNSTESEIYSKSKLLYGLYQAKSHIKRENVCILVEGYTDVISLHQSGIETAVASSGTSLTKEQAMLIKRFSEQVVLLFDGDAAGIKATSRGIDILLSENLDISIVILPEKDDPDSFVKTHGAQLFLEYIEKNKKDFILFKTDQILTESKQDPIKKIQLLKNIIQSIAVIPERIKRSVYESTCSKLLDLDEAIIHDEVQKAIKNNLGEEKVTEIKDKRENRLNAQKNQLETNSLLDPIFFDDKPFEFIIKSLIIYGQHPFMDENKKVKDYIFSELEDEEEYLHHPLFKKLYFEFKQRDKENFQNSVDHYLSHEDADVAKFIVTWIEPGYTYSENWVNKLHAPLQYQPLPEENFIAEVKYSILLFKINNSMKLSKENNEKIVNHHQSHDNSNLIIQLKTQMMINEERKVLTDKMGLVVIPQKFKS